MELTALGNWAVPAPSDCLLSPQREAGLECLSHSAATRAKGLFSHPASAPAWKLSIFCLLLWHKGTPMQPTGEGISPPKFLWQNRLRVINQSMHRCLFSQSWYLNWRVAPKMRTKPMSNPTYYVKSPPKIKPVNEKLTAFSLNIFWRR